VVYMAYSYIRPQASLGQHFIRTFNSLQTDASNSEGFVTNFDLAYLNLQSETSRDIGTLAIIGAGWNICNSWAGVAATMALSIASGGSVTLVYGLIIIFIFVGSSAATMAEIASVYPTAGGQYHWTSVLAPKKWNRGLVGTSTDP
jgi:choline transport protein